MSEQNRNVSISTPLGEDELIFQRLIGSEEMGRLFEFEIELIRDFEKGDVDSNELLGKEMTLELDMNNGETRYLNGVVTQFKQTGLVTRFIRYRAVLRPWLWLLTLTSDCKIFQDLTVVDIITEVFSEYSFADVRYEVSKRYETLEYCVQYRESDFDFISRLMEHNGIYYYFVHTDNKHQLVVTDSNVHQTVAGYEQITYFPPENSDRREVDHISEWINEHRVCSGKFELNDFDFEQSTSDLTTKSSYIKKHSQDDFEVYDYPGKYTVTADGLMLSDTRLDESQTDFSVIQGSGNAMGIQPGMEFKLEDFYFEEQNTNHYIVSASYLIEGDQRISGMSGTGDIFHCSFTAINSEQLFSPARLTRKPIIAGTQTAIVVGKQGEEIWTDKYGRVKVQFHWDRQGENNETSTCWIRVSHPLAGKNWGGISLPRIGQEVIVSFMEGDPDRPLITGRVYNDQQMPPYTLPENKTQSGMKTRSSKEGTAENFNEIRFEDKKGEEELYIHAEKDCNRVVEHNDTLKVGFENNENDNGNQTIEIYNHRTTSLDEGNDALTVKKGDYSVDVEMGKRTINVESDDATTVASGDHSLDVNSGKSTTEAAVSIELKVGGNSIKIDQSGITIKGLEIKIEGNITAEMKSPMTTVKGDGFLTLKGGLTLIN